MLLKNVGSQGVYLYEYTIATGTPRAGDAANITGSYSLDGVDHSGFAAANPTEMGGGVYWQPLSQAETSANAAAYRWASSTSGVQIDPFFVLTSGAGLPAAAPAATGGLAIVGSAPLTNLDATVSSRSTFAGGAVAAVTGNVGGNVVGSVASVAGSVAGSVGGVLGDVAGSVGGVAGNVTGSVGSVAGSVAGSVGGVATGVLLASAGLDGVTVEAGINARQALSLIGAVLAGVGGVSSGHFAGMDAAAIRVAFTATGGQRTAVTLTPPA